MLKDYYKIIIVLIILLVIGGFYWFQYRPAEAKKECNQKAVDGFKTAWAENDTDNDRKIPTSISDSLKENMDMVYKSCLHSKGL